MRFKDLMKIWILFWVLSVIIYLVLEIVNWFVELGTPEGEYIELTLSPLGIQDLTSFGFSTIEFFSVIGFSFLLLYIPWRSLSDRQNRIDSENKKGKTVFGIVVEFISLTIFEILVVIGDVVFILVFQNRFLWDFSNISVEKAIINILLVLGTNFIGIIIFHTIIAFQAYRKRGSIDTLIKKISLDYAEGIVLLFELYVLLIYWIVFSGVNFNLIADFDTSVISGLALLYWLLIGVLALGIRFHYDNQIRALRSNLEEEYSLNVLLIQLLSLYFPLALISLGFPYPLYLFIILGFSQFFFFQGVMLFIVFIIVDIYIFLGRIGVNNFISERIEPVIDQLKFHTALIMASRDTLFNYPKPINPILADTGYGESIPYREGTITLKIVCGQCHHVFKVKTAIKSDRTKSFPCPFCGSVATTPVWE
ncbi:MAG: hypothetical protein ACW964_08005 [Candidatus Hodarchaeales archaeon]